MEQRLAPMIDDETKGILRGIRANLAWCSVGIFLLVVVLGPCQCVRDGARVATVESGASK
ncbi:MAG: hypothetical protein JNL94_10965 [Planctomycetes bacterium]|nr:hypothetical protein [Planctomycetota bacterium]